MGIPILVRRHLYIETVPSPHNGHIQKRHGTVASLLANGSPAFKWKLGFHWLNGLQQRPANLLACLPERMAPPHHGNKRIPSNVNSRSRLFACGLSICGSDGPMACSISSVQMAINCWMYHRMWSRLERCSRMEGNSKHEQHTGLILDLRPPNERRRYKVTRSLIGWDQT